MKRIDISMLVEEEPTVEELKEKLWTFKRDSNALAVSVRNNPEYRSNPDNWYHDQYQNAINRQFLLFIHLFSVLWIGVFYGFNALAAFVLGVALVYIVLFVQWALIKHIVPGLISVFKEFFIEGRHL